MFVHPLLSQALIAAAFKEKLGGLLLSISTLSGWLKADAFNKLRVQTNMNKDALSSSMRLHAKNTMLNIDQAPRTKGGLHKVFMNQESRDSGCLGKCHGCLLMDLAFMVTHS